MSDGLVNLHKILKYNVPPFSCLTLKMEVKEISNLAKVQQLNITYQIANMTKMMILQTHDKNDDFKLSCYGVISKTVNFQIFYFEMKVNDR